MKSFILIAACVCVCVAIPAPVDETEAGYVRVIGDNEEVYATNFQLPVDAELSTDNERNSEIVTFFLQACLGRGNFNVIVLDWSQVSMTSYVLAISNIPRVGQDLGQFLTFLNRVTGAPLQSIHLVGFSLGSHVVGNGGRAIGGRVGRVTGLDPFSPVWETNNNRLNPNDGIYVEVIHTNGYSSSVNMRMGNTDFYPNGGNSQPGCMSSVCNHNRSWELFAATVTYDHLVGIECSSIQEVASNSCRGRRLNMGNAIVNKSGNGLYRLTTQGRYPY